jgi:CheY-like chemotaxis protein
MTSPVVLCVDDSPQLLKLRKRALEPLGYSVVTATDVSSAIAILEQLPVAAVLVEYKHEGLDAEAVAYLIKQRLPHQPVVLLSAYADMPERSLWLVDDYVLRSDPPERLAEVVERVMRPPPKPARATAAKRRDAAG